MFQFEVEFFTLHNKDLQLLLISEDEWEAIKPAFLIFIRLQDRDCHGCDKPMGECCGLAWGLSTGLAYCTPHKLHGPVGGCI